MGLLEQLQEQGWHLLPAGIERLQEGTTPGTNLDAKQAIKLALDIDLREIGGGALSSISARGTKADSIDGNIVVQVLKVRNISAPKANEESKAAPRLLKLTITDGQTQYSALEGEHVSSLSLDTAPGTKIYLKNGPIKISQGLLILNANNVSILGGKVPALVEKWELTRAMAKFAKGGRMQLSASGPPPWIPFGQKIQQNVPADKNFKSLQTKEKDESKENAEFTALRNDAIAEANKLGTKKTFGGGAKQMVDANVQKIMDKGFSEEQANHALKLTRNNVHRALSNLQRIEERKQNQAGAGGSDDFKSGKVEPPQKLGGKPSFRGKRDSESDASSKPSAKVSLFDFLEDILPETDASANKKSSSKDSTPFGGKDGKTDSYASKQSSGGYNSYSSSNPNNRSSNSAPSGGNPYQSNSTSSYNSANKSYNQQRFENNISSSFANRNTHPGANNRSYGQQNSQQQQQQNSNPSGGYKQQSYDYNNTRGYRGGPPNATGGYHNSEGHQRGGRPESKYNQSHSSYNNPPHQQSQQYRNDSYNNNNNSSSSNNATGAGPQGNNNKYAPNSGSGKSQPTSNSSYQAGGGYGGHTDSRGPQNYNGQADGGGRKHPGYQQQNQTQQQQQSSYQGSKPVQGYNATGGSVGNHTGGHQSNVANNNHYGQHNAGGANNNYSNSNSTQGPKPAKGSRYTKDESQKFTGPPPKSTTTPPVQNQSRNTGPGQQPPQKVHSNPSQQQQQQHGTAPSTAGMQPPFVNKQPSPGPPGSNHSSSVNNNAAKMAQLTEATAGMQIGNSKQYNSGSQQVMAGKPHQQPMVSGPPPHPAPATTPVVPKNYIQLPNGFNPYQIMGFQNKQTNEFALNVLKSQQFDALQTAHLAAGPLGGPPVQAVTGPIPGVPVVSSVLAPAGPGMPAGAGGVLPNWKIGDRCLAKYWEDGGFYNAEITAISENTFVVCFLEYGNYEEVLKTDCIPLTPGAPAGPPHPSAATMGFHHHPQAPLGVQPHPAMMAPHPPPPPTGAYPVQGAADSQSAAAAAQQHFNPGGYKPQPSQYPPHHGHPQQQQPPPPHHHQQRPSKFREQRPMYVPPAQRK